MKVSIPPQIQVNAPHPLKMSYHALKKKNSPLKELEWVKDEIFVFTLVVVYLQRWANQA